MATSALMSMTDSQRFSSLLRVEEFVKRPVAAQLATEHAEILKLIQQLQESLVADSPDHGKLRSKYTKTPFRGDSKLPPGSGSVTWKATDSRYVLCRLHTLLAELHLLHDEVSSAITELRMAAAWCVRSAETCEMLGATLRVCARQQSDVEEAEQWLRRAIDAAPLATAEIDAVHSLTAEGLYEEQRAEQERRCASYAGHRMLLLMLQTQRTAAADEVLRRMNYQTRLSDLLLDYPRGLKQSVPLHRYLEDALATGTNIESLPCVAVGDDALPRSLLQRLQHVFRPSASFWRQHSYDPRRALSREAGFVSYLYPFTTRKSCSVEEQLVDHLREVVAPRLGVDLSRAQLAEWWVHSREHATGHQLHFDSDERCVATQGVARHPLFSAVVYLSQAGVGGPTVVTTQRRIARDQAGPGTSFLAFPREGRIVFFDAHYLHGVIPGTGLPLVAGIQEPRRLSLMVGFWDHLDSEPLRGSRPGAAHEYPPAVDLAAARNEEPWFAEHCLLSAEDIARDCDHPYSCLNVTSAELYVLNALWDDLSSDPHPSLASGSEDEIYDRMFQGF